MTSKTTGFIISFDEEQHSEFIKERIEGTFEPFTDALSIREWGVGSLSIAFLCFSDSTIDYIALAKKGKKVVTSKSRIEFSGMINLQAIHISDIEELLPENLRKLFIRSSRGNGKSISSATWKALITSIKNKRPNLVGEIDRLLSLQRYSGFILNGDSAEILLQEREAIGISLDIFSGSNQLRERVLGEWAPNEEDVTNINEEESQATLKTPVVGRSSFLKGIPKTYLQEESTIQHDLFNWEDMSPIHEQGISTFEQGGRKLEVIYANRNALEHTLGVDLIYYNEAYELFILVQYKLMRDNTGRMLYRPDKQLDLELNRMDEFYKIHRSTNPIQTHEQFRLSDDGFMLKIVPCTGLKPASGELIKGMYIPREYMNFLVGPNGPKGSGGGSNITFENVPRYLTNSQFSSYVNAGWIGTRGVQSSTIKSIIEHFYETGRALVLAYESRKEPPQENQYC